MNEFIINDLLKLSTPVLFVGAAGVGKTATVHKNYDHVEVILLSSCSEEDIGGLPYRDGIYDRKTMPSFFERIVEADKKGLSTALFLDEIDKADRSVADTLLTLVGSRTVNNCKLPEKTKIVLAANTPEYGGGDGLSVPMLNRCIVVEFEPDPSIWASDVLSKYKSENAVSVVQMVLAGDIPILETTGEGLDTRSTSPRSLTLAIDAIEKLGSNTDALSITLKGLLTPNAASKIIVALGKVKDKKYTDLLKKTVAISKEVNSPKKSTTKTVRKPAEL